MKASLSWLIEFLPELDKIDLELLVEAFTKLGLEVSDTYQWKILQPCEKWFIGRIEKIHRRLDKTNKPFLEVTVTDGQAYYKTVTRDLSIKEGVLVGVAPANSWIYTKEGKKCEVKQKSIEGVVSECVMLSETEAGVDGDPSKIWVLGPDASPLLGKPFATYVSSVEKDIIFDLEITPNRGEVLSHLGLARELRAWLIFNGYLKETASLLMPQIHPLPPPKSNNRKSIIIEGATRYEGTQISKISPVTSPWKIKARLYMLDFPSINIIVDLTNYIMLELGQPMHAFDANKLADTGYILVLPLREDSLMFETLGGETIELKREDIVIHDGEKPVALAGIIGSSNSSVSNSTNTIFLESAHFNPKTIRRTSRRLGLQTESSLRFSRGTDPAIVPTASGRYAYLIKQYLPESQVEFCSKAYTDFSTSRAVPFNLTKLSKLLGTRIDIARFTNAMSLLDIEITGSEKSIAKVPIYRSDVERDVDILEEYLRLEDVNKLPASNKACITLTSRDKTLHEDTSRFNFIRYLTQYLTHRGWRQIAGVSFVSKKELELFSFPTETAIKVTDTVWGDKSWLRPTLAIAIIEWIHENRSRGLNEAHLFEIGKVYEKKNGQYYEK